MNQTNFGDYAVFVKDNPEKEKKRLEKKLDRDMVDKIEIIGHYVNVYYKAAYLVREAEKINYEIEFKNELNQLNNGKTVVIDYSSPNIAKTFGIGHLRSTNIGQALYNLYQILGWNCIGENHLGDYGTQFGKLITAIKKWGPINWSTAKVDDLESLYIKFHRNETEELLNEARNWFAKLENKDPEAMAIWQKCVDLSQQEFNQIYDLLDVHFDYCHGESFYRPMTDEIIQIMKDKGLTKESQGATIIEFEDHSVAIVKKSNETSTYFDRDIAALKYRRDTWHPDLIIYEVGADQTLYFKQVFTTVEKLGWFKPANLHFVGHGLIRQQQGKFSTRKGQTIHLKDIITKTIALAKKIAPDNSAEAVRAIAIGAIKFNDLAQNPRKDIIFDWQKIMNLEGNSGPYLQYTYARANSVLGKTKIKEQKNLDPTNLNLNAAELSVLREIVKFKAKIIEAAERFNPGVLAEFLLNVARKYNEFYAKNRIIGSDNEAFRIFLTRSTASLLHLGLELLGIKTLTKM